MEKVPWWGLAIVLGGIVAFFAILNGPKTREALLFLVGGLKLTILMAIVSFALAVIIGLIVGVARTSKNILIYNVASLYIGLVRGIPTLVLILYSAFVIVPFIVSGLNGVGRLLIGWHVSWAFFDELARSLSDLDVRDVGETAGGIAALAFAYGAFEAEVFRAGIESISKGQMEAARSLGMNYFQAMRYVIMPQALRVILPPVGNDLISLLKDSSLVSVVAVADMTRRGREFMAANFNPIETWSMIALLYLVLTLFTARIVTWIEKKTKLEK